MHLLVAADDRTGALETAGALADAGLGPVPVHAWAIAPTAGADSPTAAVVDLGSRHLARDRALALAAAIDDVPAARHAHKIDSTLRGNWAVELVARSVRPVLVVPALPALGRTCRGGVVRVGDVPVHESASAVDVAGRLDSSRPAELLRRAGATAVQELDGARAAAAWLAAPDGVAVCDAATDADVAAIVAAWAHASARVLLAGTAAVIGAAGAAIRDGRPAAPAAVDLRGPVLVVCGSVHAAARGQLDRLAATGALVTADPGDDARRRLAAGGVVALHPPRPDGAITPSSAHATAVRLAADVADVLGGDTTAAVLGARTVEVGGTVAPGAPWGRLVGGGPLLVTRSGGFGGPDALVELLSGTLAP